MNQNNRDERPLKAEADKRRDWRGDDASEHPRAPGHTLPQSESDGVEGDTGAGGTPPTTWAMRPPD